MINKISCSLFGVALFLCVAVLYSCTSDIDSPDKALERIGKEEAAKAGESSSSDYDGDLSSSSSSLGDGELSSSDGDNGESSSSVLEPPCEEGDDDCDPSSSSSNEGGLLSSSGEGELSSSGGEGELSSSSDEGGLSSSSEEQPSSSSEEPSSSSVPPPPPAFGECNIHEFLYTGEVITDIVSITGDASSCGNITYSWGNSSGSSYTVPNQSGNRSVTITAKAQCGNINLEKPCNKNVVVAPNKQLEARCNHHPDNSPVNLTISGTTVVEYKCPESKIDYWITCGAAEYTIRVEGETNVVSSNYGGANLLPLEPIENSGMYLYPKRILITVTNSGSYECNSW